MSNKLNQALKSISQLEPPRDLGDSILKRIETKKEDKIKMNLLFSYAGLAISFLLILGDILAFGNSFLKAEFWSIVSLAFSDFMIVAGSWREYAYSLLETFPMITAMAVLIPVFIFLLFFSLLLSLRDKHRDIHSHFNLYKNNLTA
jgi:hypothetical protein